MATSIPTLTPLWLAGCTYNEAQLDPLLIAGSFFNTGSAAVYGGVLPAGGGLKVTAGSGMQVNVAAGYAICANSAASTNGGYLLGLLSSGTLTVAGSDLTNPRIDLICIFVNDVGSSSSSGAVEILTGTPTAGATLSNLSGAPAAPSNSVVLAYLLVPANSASVSSGNIGDVRTYTAAQGGIGVVPKLASVPAGYTGNYQHDLTTGRLVHNPAAGPAQPLLLPFTPQLVLQTATVSSVSAAQAVAAVSVTTDGNTDIEIVAHWSSLYINNSGAYGAYGALMSLKIDSSQVAEHGAACATNATSALVPLGGGTLHHVTSSGVDRPGAGTHTITLSMTPGGDGTHTVQVQASASSPTLLYARPVPL